MTVTNYFLHVIFARKLFILICIAMLFIQSIPVISPINLAFTRGFLNNNHDINYNSHIYFVGSTVPPPSTSSSSLNNTTLPAGKLISIKNPIERVLIGDEESEEPFNPGQINITVGNTIMWINSDIEAHTVTSGSPDNKITYAKVFDSGNLNPKHSFEHTFDKVGTYKYFCKLHPSMLGLVNVK
jgi:plastocyanin